METVVVDEIFHIHLSVGQAQADRSRFEEIFLRRDLIFADDHLLVVQVEWNFVGDAVILSVRCSHCVLTLDRRESVAMCDELNVVFTVLQEAPVRLIDKTLRD